MQSCYPLIELTELLLLLSLLTLPAKPASSLASSSLMDKTTATATPVPAPANTAPSKFLELARKIKEIEQVKVEID